MPLPSIATARGYFLLSFFPLLEGTFLPVRGYFSPPSMRGAFSSFQCTFLPLRPFEGTFFPTHPVGPYLPAYSKALNLLHSRVLFPPDLVIEGRTSVASGPTHDIHTHGMHTWLLPAGMATCSPVRGYFFPRPAPFDQATRLRLRRQHNHSRVGGRQYLFEGTFFTGRGLWAGGPPARFRAPRKTRKVFFLLSRYLVISRREAAIVYEEIEAKEGLPSADRNNKATLLLTGPFRTSKSSAKDLTPLVLKLQFAKYHYSLREQWRNRLLRR